MRKIYLAGPISGLTYDESVDWRDKVKKALEPDIECFSPMRASRYLHAAGKLDQMGYENTVLSCPRGIMSRDHWDCKTNCDLIFVNFLGAKTVSMGTVMEIAWGFAYQKPVIVCMEESGNVHEHAMIGEATNFRVRTIEEGMEICRAVLLSH